MTTAERIQTALDKARGVSGSHVEVAYDGLGYWTIMASSQAAVERLGDMVLTMEAPNTPEVKERLEAAAACLGQAIDLAK